MSVGSDNSQKGMALIHVILTLAVTGAFITIASQMMQNDNKTRKVAAMQKVRNEVARRVQTYMLTPSFINASAMQSLGEGNGMLYHCLGYYLKIDDTPRCQPNRELPLLLVNPSSYADDCGNSKDKISCYAAGKRGQDEVGYNFRGEVGALSAQFPLKAEVFFKAVCPLPDVVSQADINKPCQFARTIELAYRITHIKFPEKKVGRFGEYPKSKEFQSMDTFRLVGKQCNEGAVVSGYDPAGNLSCSCRVPFVATGQRNINGPLCERLADICPLGFVQVGSDRQGKPRCEMMASTRHLSWKKEVCFSTDSQSCSASRGEVNCRYKDGVDVGGWVADVHPNCSSFAKLIEASGRKDPNFWIMFIPAAAAVVVTGLLWASIWMAAVVFAAIFLTIFFLLLDFDWHIVNAKPQVTCQWQVECRAFDPN